MRLSLKNSANATKRAEIPTKSRAQNDDLKKSDANDFRNVRFVPFQDQSTSAQGTMTKVMPILPLAGGRSSPFDVTASVAASKSALIRLPRQITAPRRSSTTMVGPPAFRRRVVTWSDIQSPQDPPPSAHGPPSFADTSVQTEEDKAFEDTFAPLITSLVSGVISDAHRSLMEEEEFRLIEERERKLIETIQKQNAKNNELNKVVEHQLELQKELESQKSAALQQLRALEARRLAIDALEGVENKSVDELISRKMIHTETGQRSVAADTRHLERRIARSQRVTKEVRTDFFPYVYARAERVFVERLAGTYLKDALFARDEKRRDDAHDLLNAQIFKYNQLIAAASDNGRQAHADD